MTPETERKGRHGSGLKRVSTSEYPSRDKESESSVCEQPSETTQASGGVGKFTGHVSSSLTW